MSSASTPQPSSGYASPAPTPSSSSSKPNSSKLPKPTNVFTNDGSFLERFQRTKKEEDEKKKQDDDLARKRKFDNRFKNRGKRPPPDPAPSSDPTPDEPPAKKVKSDKPLSHAEYEKQVKTYAGRSLKDNGIGVRPLVK